MICIRNNCDRYTSYIVVIVSSWKEERMCTYIDLPVHRVTSNGQTVQGEKGGGIQLCRGVKSAGKT